MRRVGDFRARWACLGLAVAGLLMPVAGCGWISGGIAAIRGVQEIDEHGKESARRDEEHQLTMSQTRQRDEEERQRREDEDSRRRVQEAEDRRVKELPAAQVDRLAERLAEIIAAELPDTKRVSDYVAEKGGRMVLTRGAVQNKARYTSDSIAENLIEKVFAKLQADPRITRRFDLVVSRTEGQKLLEASEGANDAIFDDADEDAAVRYAPSAICVLELSLFDFNEVGKTTWEAHVRVTHVRSRSILLSEEVKAP